MRGAILATALAAGSTVSGLVIDETWTKPGARVLNHAGGDPVAPVVDLDYGRYQGYYNPAFDLNIYRG
jgi:hypothetical protein